MNNDFSPTTVLKKIRNQLYENFFSNGICYMNVTQHIDTLCTQIDLEDSLVWDQLNML